MFLLFFNTKTSFASTEDWSKFNTWETKANTNKYGFGANSVGVDDKIYLFGGYTQELSTPRFEIYDSVLNKWTVQPDIPYDTRHQGCVEINGNIYVFGGQRTDAPVTDEVYCYNIESGTWTQKASILEARRSFAQCVINGKIYVAGGYGANGYLNTLECYDPEADEWTKLADMPTKRSSVAGISSNGKFYVFGGWNNSTEKYLNTVEVYDPVKNSWEKRTNMNTAKVGIKVEEYNGYIYLVGGKSSNSNSINTLECYSTYSDKWITLASIPTARHDYTVSRIDDKLYVINGSVGSTAYKTTEAYNIPNEAFLSFAFANKYKTMADIERARYHLNKLDDDIIKYELQELLNNIKPIDMPTITEDKSSSNIDLYIKPKTILTVTLDTNNISFEDFSVVDDIERINAFNIIVNSSLPYSVEVSIPINITNKDNTIIVDKNLISIKESSNSEYQTFNNSVEYLTLLDNQPAGTKNNHSIDIRLNAKVLPQTDIYKAVLRFKIEQK